MYWLKYTSKIKTEVATGVLTSPPNNRNKAVKKANCFRDLSLPTSGHSMMMDINPRNPSKETC